MTTWLPGARVIDLSSSRGNGRFYRFLGVILHVNVDENGTSDYFFEHNSGEVTPNFEVYKDGSVHQYLPFNWQPWCQINGNFNYAAIETAGMPNEPLTGAQEASIARILSVYKAEMGMKLVVTDTPGQPGFGTHQMGGLSWGGHACPGPIRAGQRAAILRIAAGTPPVKPPISGGKPVLHVAWPTWMPRGEYFGLVTGPAQSHGGINATEKFYVELIQHRLQALGFAPKTAGWADGIFGIPTAASVTAFQRKYMPGTQFFGQVWQDDWNRLFTY